MRAWDKKSIQALLTQSDKAVERAVMAIYARQTESEKATGGTTHQNGMGFGAFDAAFFTFRAKELLSGISLSPWMAQRCRERGIGRYWKQLVEVANENEVKKEQAAREAAIWRDVCAADGKEGICR